MRLHVNGEHEGYLDADRIKGIIRRYCDFLPYPIYVNGEPANTVDAPWHHPPGRLPARTYKDLHDRMFGSVLVDGKAQRAIGIDGVWAKITGWEDNEISVEVTSALKDLPYPYTRTRNLVVKFSQMSEGKYIVNINGQKFKGLTIGELNKGIKIEL